MREQVQRPCVGAGAAGVQYARTQATGQVGGSDVREAEASPHRALWVTARHEGFILPAK